MFEFIKGEIADLSPAHVVLETNGVGYLLYITVGTYSKLLEEGSARLYVHEIIREDTFDFYGFFDLRERELFRLLISVSGVGANTSRVILSSLSSEELEGAILTDNVAVLKGIKGIGLKTAQRLIVELRDKIGKTQVSTELFAVVNNTAKEEALSALTMLGFNKAASQKVIDKIVSAEPTMSVEQMVKSALKLM